MEAKAEGTPRDEMCVRLPLWPSPFLWSLDVLSVSCIRGSPLRKNLMMASPTSHAGAPPAATNRLTAAAHRGARNMSP